MELLEGNYNYLYFLSFLSFLIFFSSFRRIDEKDVMYTALPGHVAGFGALVNRIGMPLFYLYIFYFFLNLFSSFLGRGFPRSIACGTDFSVVATYPYSGPTYAVASNIMEEARIREQESQLMAIYGPS